MKIEKKGLTRFIDSKSKMIKNCKGLCSQNLKQLLSLSGLLLVQLSLVVIGSANNVDYLM
jgi:hypothetical protein